MKLQNVLATKGTAVVTIASHASLESAASLMTEQSIGALVVLDDLGELCGIISERDVVRSIARRVSVRDLQVRHSMTRDVAVASSGDDVADALRRMTVGRFRHLPVLQGDQLIGIVSIGDLVKAQLREYEGVIITLETELMEVVR